MRNTWVALSGRSWRRCWRLARPPQPASLVTIGVAVDQPGAAISPTLYGLFFEDINFGADGGLYPEKVKNRSFEFPDPMMGWKRAAVEGARGIVANTTDAPPSPPNPHYLRIDSESGRFGVTNEGFRGIGVGEGRAIHFLPPGARRGAGPARCASNWKTHEGSRWAGRRITGLTTAWKSYPHGHGRRDHGQSARFRVLVEGPGAVDIDLVSLFPKETWKGRENGLRADLVQLLRDMKPGFLRFPGGCIVEGRYLDGRYQWKTTIGDPAERTAARQSMEQRVRQPPDARLLPVVRTRLLRILPVERRHRRRAAADPQLRHGLPVQFGRAGAAGRIDHYIQDAIDLIEFANGPVTSPWGAKRAAMGHPAPFNLKMIGVGNEQWGPQYVERYALFAKVLKRRSIRRSCSSPAPAPSAATTSVAVRAAAS